MKINDKELANLSLKEVTFEGRLHHKKVNGNFTQPGFKERWFKLRANILFYFNLNETGKIYDNKKPSGAIILENSIIQCETISETPFAFSILFHDDGDRKHFFSGRSEENVRRWVDALKEASYEFWRRKLMVLQRTLSSLTGKDPLLMYPRNEGSKLRAEAEEKAGRNERTVSGRSFRSYLNQTDFADKKIPSVDSLNLNEPNSLMFDGSDSISLPGPTKPPRSKPCKPGDGDSSVNLIDL